MTSGPTDVRDALRVSLRPPRPPAAPTPDDVSPAAVSEVEPRARATYPALRALCEAFDLHPDARTAMRALAAAGRVETDADTDASVAPLSLRILAGALPAVGLRAHVERGPASSLVVAAVQGGLCVAAADASLTPGAPSVLGVIAMHGMAGAPVTVQRITLRATDEAAPAVLATEPETVARADADSLPARLGAAPGSELWWVAASPLLPLAALGPGEGEGAASGEGAEAQGHGAGGHGGNHGHGGGHGSGHGHGGGHGHDASPFARLWALARLERDDLWIVLVYATGVGLLSLATPVAVQALVNTVAFGALVFPVIVLALLLAGVLAFAGVLHALQMQVVEAIQQRVFTRVALDLAHRFPRVRAEALDRAWGPELVNRFFDVLTVQKSASTFLLDGLSLVLSAGIGMLVLAFYHPVLLAFDIVLIASVVGLLWGLGRRGPKTAIYESKAKYRVAAWLEDLARSGATFRSPYGSALASSRADELARGYLSARRESFKVVFRQYAGVLALQAVATAVLLGLGGWLVVVRQLTLGQLVASELIVATVVSNLSKLGRKIDAYYDLLAAVDKLGHLVDLPLEPARGGADLPRGNGPARLAVEGLHYGYEGGATLHFPSFEVSPGERIALVGGAGAGKSTLADILYGLRSPGAGHVEIDGVDARSLPAHVLRAHVGLVRATDALVIEGTLAENVALGRPEIGHVEARAALEAVGLGARVRSLPHGVGTTLAATGAPLGSTDLRRVTIARAIAAAPRLLVVDGGVAGLDAEARAAVQSALLRLGASWTLIVLAAPDDPLVGLCDRVLRLDEAGAHGGTHAAHHEGEHT